MAGGEDRRWPGAEAIMAAALGIAREVVSASMLSAPAGRLPERERRAAASSPSPEPKRAEENQRRLAAPVSRAALAQSRVGAAPRHAAPDAAVAASRAEGPARHAAPEPDSTPPAPPDRPPAALPARTPPALPVRASPPPRVDRRPPDRKLVRDLVSARRRGPFLRAAERIGGQFWGVRFAFSLISALMLLTVTGFAFERLTGVDVLPDGPAARFWPAPHDFPVLDRSLPVSIRARSVRINAPIHPVGTAPSGAIDVPRGDRFNEAGWYKQGPTPGEYGPAVIVGHVDNGSGPSVFHKLSRLRPGNRVEITRKDGKVAVFEVNSVKRFDRDNLPADQVFEDFSRPGLRLITCGGRWVGGTTGYADNIVVFASLVKARGRG
jgi:Sortase domain